MNIKVIIKAFGYSLLAGIVAGIIARFAAFPIMGLLHNRWITIISSETVNHIYFWIGQIVGSIVFIIYMFIDLRKHDWSKLASILAGIISIIFLFIIGIMLSSI